MVTQEQAVEIATKHKYTEDEITCICNAYPDHPHRLGGGKCTGSGWVESARSIDSYDCDGCNMNDNGSCDVIEGLEPINNERCECIAQEIKSRYLKETFGNLPLDEESYHEKMHREYYDREE